MFVPKPAIVVGQRYELQRVIGSGGMGQVWEANDRELGNTCAVKFILAHIAQDEVVRRRFEREAKAVAALRSPHAVHILSFGEHEGVMYLAMELLDGETLRARLSREGRLSVEATLAIVEQIAHPLEKARQRGIVHRDLKPENIWLWSGSNVFVKVLDFGIAKSHPNAGSLHTATGAVLGTPQYMSPEQALGNRSVDHRSDLWALAIIAVECLGGKRPFESAGFGDLIVKIVSTSPPPLAELAPVLPPSCQGFWERGLARDPAERFQSAAELVEALRASLVGPSRPVRAPAAPALPATAGSPRSFTTASFSAVSRTPSPVRPSPPERSEPVSARSRRVLLAVGSAAVLGVLGLVMRSLTSSPGLAHGDTALSGAQRSTATAPGSLTTSRAALAVTPPRQAHEEPAVAAPAIGIRPLPMPSPMPQAAPEPEQALLIEKCRRQSTPFCSACDDAGNCVACNPATGCEFTRRQASRPGPRHPTPRLDDAEARARAAPRANGNAAREGVEPRSIQAPVAPKKDYGF